jgi:hypothetical protein
MKMYGICSEGARDLQLDSDRVYAAARKASRIAIHCSEGKKWRNCNEIRPKLVAAARANLIQDTFEFRVFLARKTRYIVHEVVLIHLLCLQTAVKSARIHLKQNNIVPSPVSSIPASDALLAAGASTGTAEEFGEHGPNNAK